MFVSVTSVLSLIFWGNIMIIAIYAACRIPRIFNKMNCNFMIWLLIITFLRFLLPVESKLSISIYFEHDFIEIIRFIRLHTIRIAEHTLYIYQILLFIWFSVSLILLLRMIRKYLCFQKEIKDLIDRDDTISIDTIKGYDLPDNIDLYKSTVIPMPLITGIINPVIILPSITLNDEETMIILKHELQHYKYKDIILKFCLQLFCILYWWNPAMYIVKKQLLLLLEIRADSGVYETLNAVQKINYLECLKKMSTNSQGHPDLGINFTGSNHNSVLLKRMEYLAEEQEQKSPIIASAIFSLLLLSSLIFVFEPYNRSAEIEEGTFTLPENTYIIQTEQGNYEIYFNDEYGADINDPYTEGLDVLPIYKFSKDGEVIRSHEKKKIPCSFFCIPVLFILLFCLCIRPGLWKRK